MHALLLAAGRGERLRPLTDVVPKPAIPLPGGPLGAWMLERLLGRFETVSVNCSHLARLVISQLGLEGRAEILREDPEPLGTGGTLAELRGRLSERIVVANADVISDVDVSALLQLHQAEGTSATVAVQQVGSGADFAMAEDGRVAGFLDRRTRGEAGGTRFVGVSVYERAALERLPDERPLGLGESLLAPLAEEGELTAYMHEGYVADVGTLQRYAAACADVLDGTAPPAPPGPYEAYAGDSISVDGGSAFVASSASCDESSVGPGAVILGGAQVPRGSTVRHAIVWPHEEVPPKTEVRDCIWFRGRPLTMR